VATGFRKTSCSNNKLRRDGDSKKGHPALATIALDPAKTWNFAASALNELGAVAEAFSHE
jgi:hypothetical protein